MQPSINAPYARLRATAEEFPRRRLLMAILVVATVYQLVLCFIHTHVFGASTAVIGLTELSIYVVCAFLLFKRIELSLMAVLTLFGAYLLLLALLRGAIDIKSFRDIYSLIVFFYLGRNYGDVAFADRVLKIIIAIVIAVGLFELLFVDLYSKLFNVYSYYVAQGSVASTNWAEGSTLALNGTRPAGIGRTILPALLGNHRVSSVFLEPVSLGNFAVIVASWGLCKSYQTARRDMLIFCAAAAFMIILADSRYGMVTVLLITLVRMMFSGLANRLFMLMPFACALILVLFGLYYGHQHYGDNIPGRLYASGATLVNFGLGELFGLKSYARNYGDMGYSIILTRFGLIGCAILWIGLWMVKMRDETGERFRSYIAIYICLILCVSGTSLFALKSAGILWFLFGSVSAGAAVRTVKQRAGMARAQPTLSGKVHHAT